MVSVTLAHRTASAAPSAAWVEATARAAAQLAAGQGVERLLSAESAKLFRSVLRAMTMTKLKIVGLGGLVLAATAVGMVMAWGRMGNPQVVDRPPPNDVPPVAAAAAAAVDLAADQRQVFEEPEAALPGDGELPRGPRTIPGTRDPGAGRQAAPELARRHTAVSGRSPSCINPSSSTSPGTVPTTSHCSRGCRGSSLRPARRARRRGDLTHFRIFVGKGTPFEGGQGPRWEDISDGTDRTILIVEADEAVPWTKPDELPYAADKPLPALGGGPRGSFLAAMVDGRVLAIPAKFDEALLRRAITRNDKQPLDLDRLGAGQPLPPPPRA